MNAQTYVFARLDGIPMNTTGWTLKGEAAVKDVVFTDKSELLLCSAKNNTSGAVFFNQPIDLSLCSRWKAEFDFRMNGGNAADGIAFNFLDAPPTGFVLGEGLGIPAGANGLKVCFDTYNNCISPSSSNVPKIEIRYGTGYNECSPQPTLENINNSLSFLRSATYNHALISYDNGNITVSVNGTVMLTATQSFNFSGYLGFTASTGGSTDNHSIRNVIIYTDMPPSEAGNNLVSNCNIINAAIGTSATAGNTYTWSPASGLSNTAISNPTVQITNNTGSVILQKYYVKTAFSSNPGCFSMDSITVQVNPKPAVSFTGSIPAVCSNAAAFTVTGGSPAGGVYSGPGITGASFSPILAGVGTHTITYTYTDVSGCSNAATNTIRVNAFAQVVARNDVAICTGSSVALTATNASSYLWSPSVGLSTTTGSSITASPITSTTYTVNAKDANGCNSSDQVVVTVQSMPTASIRFAGSPFCGNTQVPVILTGLTGGTFSAPVGLSIQPTTGSINLAASTPGVYSVTYTFSNGACTNFTKTGITILAPPIVTFNNVLPTACLNGSAFSVTGGSPVGGVYSGAGITGASFQPGVAGGGMHVITYTYTHLGCTNSATNTITIYPIENVVASSPVAICSGGSVMISATNASSYLWSPATGLSSTTGASVLASPLTTTLYTVTGLDNASGCSSQDQVTVTFLQVPVASISYPGSPFCNQGTISVSQIGQSGGTYQSTAGLVVDVATGLINLSNSTPGTYTVTYTFTNGGCGSFTQTSVTILPPPTVTLNEFSPVCFTTTPFVLAGGLPSGGIYAGPGITSGIFSPSVAGTGIHILTYTYTNGSGCMGSVTSTIIVNPLTPVAAISDLTTCLGQAVTLTAVQSVSYQWMPGGLSGSSVTVTPFTNTRYTVIGTHADGCVSQDEVWVLVIPTPVASIAYPGSPFCKAGMASVSFSGQAGGIFSADAGLQLDVNNGSIDLANSNPGTYTVTYTFSNGVCTEFTQTILTIFSPPVVSYSNSLSSVCNNATPFLLSGGFPLGGTYAGVGIVVAGTFNPSLAGRGIHTITYTYTSAQGCVNAATQIVTVNPLVNVNAGSDLSICLGSAAIITASNALLYAWSPSSNLSAVSGSEVIATPITNTTYYVTGTDAAGCTSTDEVMITVYPIPVATIQYATPVFCNTGIALVTQSGQPNGMYSANAGLILNTTTGAIDLAASTPGSYTITYVFSDGSCSNQTSTNLTILGPASVSFTLPVSSVCASSAPFSIIGGSPLGGVYSGPGVTGVSFSPAAAGTGVHVLTYTYTNAGGCISSATASITVNPLVHVKAGLDVTICLGNSVSLTATDAISYSWSPNQYLSGTTSASVVASPITTTTYTVTGMDVNGCSSSDAVIVNVLPLPTATINYPGNPFCKTGTVNVIRTGIVGGLYTAGSGLALNPNTGTIDLFASNSGTYSVTYSFSNGSCSNQVTTQVTIIDLPSVSFMGVLPSVCLQAAPFTLTGGNPLGGVYRGVGIKGDVLNPSLAGIGTHVIEYTYTNPKGCAAMASNTITITTVTGGTTALLFSEVCVGSNSFTLEAGSQVPAGGQFSGAGVNANKFDPLQAGIGKHIIKYVTNAVAGCSIQYTGTIQVNPKPALQVTSLKKVCEGNQVLISPIASGELFWSDSTGTLNRFTTGGLTFKPTRSISYLITCKDAKGCTNSQPVTIQVDPIPDASFSYGSTNFCSGGNATVLMAGLSGGIFSANASVAINAVTGQINLAKTPLGNHTVTYSVTSAAGCKSVSQQTITVKPVPVLSLSNLILCSGSVQAITFTGSALGSNWTSGNPAIATIDASGVVQGLQAGQTLVRFTNNEGCTSNVAVTVKDLPRLSGKQLVCKLDSIQVSTTATFGDFAKFVSQTPGIATVNSRGIVRGNRAGTAIIEFRDNYGCAATHMLKVDSVPERQPAPALTCEPGTIRLDQPMISTYGSSGYTFTYWKDSIQTSLLNSPLRITQSGIYFVQVKNANGCNIEKPVKIKVAVAKAIIARRLDTVRTQNNVPVQLKARTIGTEFSWSPSAGLSSPFIREPWFSYMKNMEYQVTLRTDSGCLVTDTVFVKAVDANIFVPSAFTPNTDGKNDKFAPVCYSIARLNFFSVFNRWGELQFTTNTIGKGWDGTSKGAAADASTYVWMLEAVGMDGQVFRQKGTVVLIR